MIFKSLLKIITWKFTIIYERKRQFAISCYNSINLPLFNRLLFLICSSYPIVQAYFLCAQSTIHVAKRNIMHESVKPSAICPSSVLPRTIRRSAFSTFNLTFGYLWTHPTPRNKIHGTIVSEK